MPGHMSSTLESQTNAVCDDMLPVLFVDRCNHTSIPKLKSIGMQ